MVPIPSHSNSYVRHDKGTPAGGRFAEHTHAESDVQLGSPEPEAPRQTPRERAERWQEVSEKAAEHKRLYGHLPANSQIWFRSLDSAATETERLGQFPPAESAPGRWIIDQRGRHRNGNLRPDQVMALDARIPQWRQTQGGRSLGPRVALPRYAEDVGHLGEFFQQRVEEVMAYRLKHGQLPVKNPAKPESYPMAIWLTEQRAMLRKGELGAGRKKALDELFPEWADVKAARWAKTADEVADFKATHGKLPGDNQTTPRERALQSWLKRQKTKEAEGKLTEEQIEALNRVDGDWRANQGSLHWENGLTAAMMDFQKQGTIAESSEPVRHWLQLQRGRLASGELNSGQQQALDEGVPGWRNPSEVRDFRWAARAREVQQHLAATQRLPLRKAADVRISSMGVWIRTQRSSLRQGRLPADRLAYLDENVPGWRGPELGGK